ncbi:MAG: hypothetical protein JKX72_03815 [Robiginitomaculum sp.]|nr:hypothetical protein [Robiginitomaculum sp.]
MTFTVQPDGHSLSQTDVLRELIKVVDGGKACARLDELDQTFDVPRNRIATRISGLMGRGLARSSRMGCYAPTASGRALIASGGSVKSGPKKGFKRTPRAIPKKTLQARLWRSILVLKRATVSEIVQRAAVENDANPIPSCRRYVANLARAGYLIKLPRRKKGGAPTSNGEIIYWLVESHGRLPPRVRAKNGERGMYDPNTASWRPFKESQPTPKAEGAAA